MAAKRGNSPDSVAVTPSRRSPVKKPKTDAAGDRADAEVELAKARRSVAKKLRERLGMVRGWGTYQAFAGLSGGALEWRRRQLSVILQFFVDTSHKSPTPITLPGDSGSIGDRDHVAAWVLSIAGVRFDYLEALPNVSRHGRTYLLTLPPDTAADHAKRFPSGMQKLSASLGYHFFVPDPAPPTHLDLFIRGVIPSASELDVEVALAKGPTTKEVASLKAEELALAPGVGTTNYRAKVVVDFGSLSGGWENPNAAPASSLTFVLPLDGFVAKGSIAAACFFCESREHSVTRCELLERFTGMAVVVPVVVGGKSAALAPEVDGAKQVAGEKTVVKPASALGKPKKTKTSRKGGKSKAGAKAEVGDSSK